MIPKIIHQTWKDTHVPDHLLAFVQTWKMLHPGWDYILWTDEMNRNFIALHYPQFLSVYDAFPFHIQRVDAVRYFILLQQGGVFVDLDFECLKNIEPVLKEAQFVAGLEPPDHAATHNKNYIISNAFMAAPAGHLLLAEICRQLVQKEGDADKTYNGPTMILETTGPFMLSRVYEAFQQKHTVNILPHQLLFPLSKNPATGRIHRNGCSDENKLQRAYAIHHHWGSWWQPD